MCMHHVAVTPILSTLDGSYDYPRGLAIARLHGLTG